MDQIFPVLVSGVFVFFAAYIAASISQSSKISEFRQKWIIDLREDIATYLGLTAQLHLKVSESASLPKKEGEGEEKNIIDAKVVLWRIKMRINPAEKSCELLKREWEVTKKLWPFNLCSCFCRR